MKMQEIYGLEKPLKGSDREVYNYICINGFITSQIVTEITKIKTKSGASVLLNRLIRVGVVEKVRQGKHFIYVKKS